MAKLNLLFKGVKCKDAIERSHKWESRVGVGWERRSSVPSIGVGSWVELMGAPFHCCASEFDHPTWMCVVECLLVGDKSYCIEKGHDTNSKPRTGRRYLQYVKC